MPRPFAASIIGIILGALILLASACMGTPGYMVDIFPEMHYAPFYRPQEPSRLSPPAGAVPITGKETPYTLAEARVLRSPLPSTPENLARGVQVFMVNCAVCPGATGRGNGPVSDRFAGAGATRPADYTSQDIRSFSDGDLFFSITNGVGLMPRFGPILSADDRWAVIQYIHATQQ